MNKSILSNKWLKLGVSVLTIAYLGLTLILAYWSFLYEIEFHNERAFIIIYVAASVIFLILMFYTRKQLPTRIISMALLLPVFLLIIFNSSRPELYLPPLTVGIIMFFSCTASENVKVIMGTIYILMYVVGLVAFSVACTLFGGSSVETKINSSAPVSVTSNYDMAKIDNLNAMCVSPGGKYRYYIKDVQDNSRGKVIIVVEPNDLDKEYRYFTLREAGYATRVAIHNTSGVTPDIRWIDDSTITYTFGDGEWNTSKIQEMKNKNYLRFLRIG